MLLGDPRTCLNPEAPRGVIPLRVRQGARYRYVEIPGLAAAADGDLFYNSRLQMANMAGGKFILVDHPGGDLEVRLQADPPWHWAFSDAATDALDFTFVYLPGTDRWQISVVLAAAGLLAVFLMWRRRRIRTRALLPALSAGVGLALIQLIYAETRLPSVAITSKPVAFSAVFVIGTAVFGFCAAAVFLSASSRRARLAGPALAVLPGLAPALLHFSTATFFNAVHAWPALGAEVYGYRLTWMALIGSAAHALIFLGFARLLDRPLRARRRKENFHPGI